MDNYVNDFFQKFGKRVSNRRIANEKYLIDDIDINSYLI